MLLEQPESNGPYSSGGATNGVPGVLSQYAVNIISI